MTPNGSEFIIIITTTSNQAEARKIAVALVEGNLAACVQIDGPIESHYRWQGRLQCDAEWRVSIKTTNARFREVEDAILRQHSYDQPQVIALPVVNGNAGYLDWLREQTQ